MMNITGMADNNLRRKNVYRIVFLELNALSLG